MLAWGAFEERAGARPGAYLRVPLLARSGIHAIFTTRLGGRSDPPYASLNLSYVSGDDPATVRANRARALQAIGGDASGWTGGRQVHGAGVRRVGAHDRGRGAADPDSTLPDTDALVTDEPGIPLAVLVADCVPLLLADPRARRIAVVHAGWRGLVSGVVENAAAAFDSPSRVVAIAGPSIGPCCYEVGADVARPAAERFGAGVLRDGRLDLWTATAAALRAAGVGDATFAALCTRCEPHRFYSHRAGDAGRQGLLALLDR